TQSIKVNAREIWKEIIKQARDTAEPGLLFWDNILRESPADCYSEQGFNTICTNPCAELPLCEFDSCRLTLINTFSYVDNPFTKSATFNFDKFKEDAKIAQRLLDDIIDIELELIQKIINKVKKDPEDKSIKNREIELWTKIYEKCLNGRRTGLGPTA